jgi:hypothetical protein
MNTEMARAGAKWWADVLRDGAKMDNGDQSQTGGMVFAMAIIGQAESRSEQDEEQYQRFEDELATVIEESDDKYGLYVGVDYHPDSILSDAAERAELVHDGITTFPWKTSMSFRDGKITVGYGYRAPMVQIYPKETK